MIKTITVSADGAISGACDSPPTELDQYIVDVYGEEQAQTLADLRAWYKDHHVRVCWTGQGIYFPVLDKDRGSKAILYFEDVYVLPGDMLPDAWPLINAQSQEDFPIALGKDVQIEYVTER